MTNLFWILGVGSLVAIALGLEARNSLGQDLANFLLFGGVAVGCANVIILGIRGVVASGGDDKKE